MATNNDPPDGQVTLPAVKTIQPKPADPLNPNFPESHSGALVLRGCLLIVGGFAAALIIYWLNVLPAVMVDIERSLSRAGWRRNRSILRKEAGP